MLLVAPTIAPTPHNTRTAEQRWHHTVERWTLKFIKRIWRWRALEGIGIIAAIVYACISILQWRDSHRAYQLDERPYMKAAYERPDIVLGKPIETAGDLMNVGKTPAMSVHAWIEVELLRSNEEPHLVGHQIVHHNGTGILFNNEKIRDGPFPRMSGPENEAIPLSDEDVANLTSGRCYVSIHGVIEYFDIFGNKHWTHTCQWFAYSRGVFLADECSTYNGVDHN